MQTPLSQLLGDVIENLQKIKLLAEEGETATPMPVSEESTEEKLLTLSHAELRKLAKSLGVKSSGTKDVLIANLTEYYESADPEDEEEEDDNTPTAVEAPEEDSEEDDESLQDKIEAMLKDVSDEEIKEILASIEYSTTGKRQALIAKVVKAVEAGDLELDDEDDEEVTSPTVAPDEEEEEEYEFESREEALERLVVGTKRLIEEGDMDDDDMLGFLKVFHGEDYKLPRGKKLFDEYIKAASDMIDDEGEAHDFGEAYTIDEVPYCCGHPLVDDIEEEGNLYCETCNTSYETE